MARRATVVVDLGLGDQGKGTMVDWLARTREVDVVARYNGGAQAGHNVVTPDGRHHTFAQLGAASFLPGVRTVLSRHVAISPWALLVEDAHLARAGVGDGLARTEIAEDAIVVTPFHGAANRLRERARGSARHGSVGVGVGEAVSAARRGDESLRADDVRDAARARAILERIEERVRDERADERRALRGDAAAREDVAWLEDAALARVSAEALDAFRARAAIVDERAIQRRLRASRGVVLEGAQGVLLDEAYGFHPHTTWSDCTPRQALALLRECAWDGAVDVLGVARAYATRHGEGPLVTEDRALTVALPEPHNTGAGWQGAFRVGHADGVALRYAIAACERVDALAIARVDRVAPPAMRREIAVAYELEGRRVSELRAGADLEAQAALTRALAGARPEYASSADVAAHLAAIEREAGVRIAVVSEGPTARDKRAIG